MQSIILTGSSGFLGKIIYQKIAYNKVITVGRNNAEIITDLCTQVPYIPKVDLVIHSAGKAHSVPTTPSEKEDFFNVNVIGTRNLLKSLEVNTPKKFVFISSVAVYGKAKGELITEDTPLLAEDAYGLSKIEAEKMIENWCRKNNVVCTILRLPLIIGENPPGNLGAMISAIKNGYYFNISDGTARKSMVLATDIADDILKISEIGGIYNLTDGYHPSFKELSTYLSQQLNINISYNIPAWIAKIAAIIGDLGGKNFPINSKKLFKITQTLTYDDSKARKVFNWNPKQVLGNFKI